MPEIVLVTGKINSGKTTAMVKLAEQERSKGKTPGGIVAHGVYSSNRKIGYDIENLITGDIVPLARTDWDIEESFPVGRFIFSRRGFEFARKALLSFKKDDIIFLDEAGPLELKGEGYADCLKNLLDSDISRIYISVREGCLHEFSSIFLKGKKYRIMSINKSD